MSDFMSDFMQKCKDEKSAGKDHYSKAFSEATHLTGQYRYIPKSSGMIKMDRSTEGERASVYGLGSVTKAYDLYDDKNRHTYASQNFG
jgi:hypothetical protein